ncbi:hypothetical protein GCM10022232_82120 [Streptomyces plumbiresistens]|uniref:Enoyl reductase (ER) domain-containing protein n=1 Tax=Streptomyces plumbiresistens TaxID=511811 RepID=A0ABP7TCU2_9ACTN
MTNPDTPTMRAIRQDAHGSPEVLKEVELPRPEPGLSEILIAVRAAGVNPTDWWNRAQPMTASGLPLILGWDVSGVVEAVGTGVTLFKPGHEVFGMLPYPHGVGTHAEYVTGPARAFVHKPAGIDHVQAGALPLAALTAYQALVDTADIQPGQRDGKIAEHWDILQEVAGPRRPPAEATSRSANGCRSPNPPPKPTSATPSPRSAPATASRP